MRVYLILITLILSLTTVRAQQKSTEIYNVRWQADAPVVAMPVIDRKRDRNMSVLFSDGTLFKSDNGGESWSEDNKVALELPGSSWLFSNKKGDLFRVNQSSGTTLESAVSDDHGSTWKDLGKLEMPFIKGKPRLFFDPDRDRMAVTYIKEEDCRVNLMFVNSSNARKFDDAVPLIKDGLDCNEVLPTQPDIVIDSRDYLFATWAQGESVYMDRSYNDGETWLRSDILIKKRSGRSGRPMLAVDRSESMLKGAMYLVWADSVEGGRLLKCARSTENGDVWTSGIPIHPNVADVHVSQVKLDQSNGFLYVLYFVAASDSEWDLILAYSNDGGQTFKPTRLNSDPLEIPAELLEKPIVDLDVHGGKLMLVWSTVKGGEQQFKFKALSFDQLQKAEGQLN